MTGLTYWPEIIYFHVNLDINVVHFIVRVLVVAPYISKELVATQFYCK